MTPTPTPESHIIPIWSRRVTTTGKMHKTQNQKGYIKTLNEHTYAQANTLIQNQDHTYR